MCSLKEKVTKIKKINKGESDRFRESMLLLSWGNQCFVMTKVIIDSNEDHHCYQKTCCQCLRGRGGRVPTQSEVSFHR